METIIHLLCLLVLHFLETEEMLPKKKVQKLAWLTPAFLNLWGASLGGTEACQGNKHNISPRCIFSPQVKTWNNDLAIEHPDYP